MPTTALASEQRQRVVMVVVVVFPKAVGWPPFPFRQHAKPRKKMMTPNQKKKKKTASQRETAYPTESGRKTNASRHCMDNAKDVFPFRLHDHARGTPRPSPLPSTRATRPPVMDWKGLCGVSTPSTVPRTTKKKKKGGKWKWEGEKKVSTAKATPFGRSVVALFAFSRTSARKGEETTHSPSVRPPSSASSGSRGVGSPRPLADRLPLAWDRYPSILNSALPSPSPASPHPPWSSLVHHHHRLDGGKMLRVDRSRMMIPFVVRRLKQTTTWWRWRIGVAVAGRRTRWKKARKVVLAWCHEKKKDAATSFPLLGMRPVGEAEEGSRLWDRFSTDVVGFPLQHGRERPAVSVVVVVVVEGHLPAIPPASPRLPMEDLCRFHLLSFSFASCHA